MQPVSIMFREDERNPGHVRLSVFVGRTDGARGHAGEIVMRADEWDQLQSQILDGEILIGVHVPLETP